MDKIYMDELIKEFEEKAKNAYSKYKYPKNEDEIYNVDIHIWRHKGMGNSLHTISGNKVSIMTATCSFLTTLCIKDVATIEELKDMLKIIEKVLNIINKK